MGGQYSLTHSSTSNFCHRLWFPPQFVSLKSPANIGNGLCPGLEKVCDEAVSLEKHTVYPHKTQNSCKKWWYILNGICAVILFCVTFKLGRVTGMRYTVIELVTGRENLEIGNCLFIPRLPSTQLSSQVVNFSHLRNKRLGSLAT